MKKIIFILMALVCSTNLFAQQGTGDLYKGLTRSIPEGRTIIPYGLEITFEKTVHLIFPSKIRYVDLGSSNIIAAQADDADNVLRVKAAFKDFETETNMSVICEDGSYYVFNVKYAKEPQKLSIEMKDFLSDSPSNMPTNRSDIYFKELGSESPVLVRLMMKTIHDENKRSIKYIGARELGMLFSLRSIHVHNGLMYFNLGLQNKTNIGFKVDNLTFRVVDRKVAKRTAIQELVLQPLRAYNYRKEVDRKSNESMIFALEAITLPQDKRLEITVYEAGGSRNLTLYVDSEDLVEAKDISNLRLRF